jgi:hypothetical protein
MWHANFDQGSNLAPADYLERLNRSDTSLAYCERAAAKLLYTSASGDQRLLTWIKTVIRARGILFTLSLAWANHGQKTTETTSCDPQASEASTSFCYTQATRAKNPRIAIVNCSNAGQFCQETARVTRATRVPRMAAHRALVQ